MTTQALNRPVDVLAGERDARTIYDIACIREEQLGASREDVEFKAIALRNYRFCAAVAELIEALSDCVVDMQATEDHYGEHPRAQEVIARAKAALAAVEGQP